MGMDCARVHVMARCSSWRSDDADAASDAATAAAAAAALAEVLVAICLLGGFCWSRVARAGSRALCCCGGERIRPCHSMVRMGRPCHGDPVTHLRQARGECAAARPTGRGRSE